MPSVHRVSKYRRHKPSGQAVVTLSGRDIYLGRWGSKASRIEYGRLIGEWLASGRCLPNGDPGVSVAELALAYWRYAKDYYRKDGQPTGSLPRLSPKFPPQLGCKSLQEKPLGRGSAA